MADAFVKHHLLNPKEFWTTMPLPSIAANDAAFRNIPGNNWSGQPQGLTYQRAIRALENYGHYAEVTLIGKKLIEAVQNSGRFTQQFDAFSTQANNTSDGYGPTILAVLEYISRMYGVAVEKEMVSWSKIKNGANDSVHYQQVLGDKTFSLTVANGEMKGSINNQQVFRCSEGVRIVTDMQGRILYLAGIDTRPHAVNLMANNKKYAGVVVPNAVYKPEGSKLRMVKKVPFDYKPEQ
jgi:hypothetical protein